MEFEVVDTEFSSLGTHRHVSLRQTLQENMIRKYVLEAGNRVLHLLWSSVHSYQSSWEPPTSLGRPRG